MARGRYLKGFPASPGLTAGVAYVVRSDDRAAPQFHIPTHTVERELLRFDEAISLSCDQLRTIRDRLSDSDSSDHLLILEAHLMMLSDTMLVDGVKTLIIEEHINAEWALLQTREKLRQTFDSITDDYFRERGSDIQFVCERVMRNLMGMQASFQFDQLPDNTIIFADDLSPAHTTQLSHSHVRAFVLETGSRTSHAAIVARSLNIPAVVGLLGALTEVGTGDRVLVNGDTGEVVLSPTEEEWDQALSSEADKRSFEQALIVAAQSQAVTRDGELIHILGNIEVPVDAEQILLHGGEGIGLYRSEFLFMNQAAPPTEEIHFEHYQAIAEQMGHRTVTIRTLDLGGDKLFGDTHPLADERNPALGLRALRLCFREPELFGAQLRAILRIAQSAHVRLLLPMVNDVEDIRRVKALIAKEERALFKRHIQLIRRPPLGVMIETPSAALLADTLASEVDFFSIGTNDLIQYSLAIDRTNEHVAALYRPLHPAVLRLIHHSIQAANRAGIHVSLCGEMASEILCVPVLLGLGLRHLSMHAHAIPWVKRLVRELSIEACEALAKRLLTLPSASETEELAVQFLDRLQLNHQIH